MAKILIFTLENDIPIETLSQINLQISSTIIYHPMASQQGMKFNTPVGSSNIPIMNEKIALGQIYQVTQSIRWSYFDVTKNLHNESITNIVPHT